MQGPPQGGLSSFERVEVMKYSRFAIISVVLFVGLLTAYWAGYQNGKSANPTADTEQATLVIPDAPVLAQTTEPQSNGEQSTVQVAAIDPEDFDPADICLVGDENPTKR
jgi:hypothetical protein